MARAMRAGLLLAFLCVRASLAKVQCNSTVDTDQNGECTGDYCFNIENKILGCVDFYKMIRDDNIACGHMHLMGAKRKVCVCTQPYCGKYEVANMPMQTLANVNCTDDTSPEGYCNPGPCYVGNDLRRYGPVNATDRPAMQQTCMPDWFAVTNFKGLIMYEVPPLANHSACFFDSDGLFNCMCKDPGCNSDPSPSMNATEDEHYFACHKMACRADEDHCGEAHLGNETCLGQMCYYLSTVYDFQLDGRVYNESHFVRDCLNYSHPDPIGDLTFATGFQFGKSSSVFYPCYGDYCNAKTNDQTTTQAPPPPSTTKGTSTVAASTLFITALAAACLIRAH